MRILKYSKRLLYSNEFIEKEIAIPSQITDEEMENIEVALNLNKTIILSSRNSMKTVVLVRILRELNVCYVFENDLVRIKGE